MEVAALCRRGQLVVVQRLLAKSVDACVESSLVQPESRRSDIAIVDRFDGVNDSWLTKVTAPLISESTGLKCAAVPVCVVAAALLELAIVM